MKPEVLLLRTAAALWLVWGVVHVAAEIVLAFRARPRLRRPRAA